jgi:ERF superfamily
MPDDAALVEATAAPTPAPTPAPPPDDATAIFSLIERAARDPSVDIEKFKALFALRREAEADRARIEFAQAFAALLPELPIVDRKGRIVVYSKTDREKPGGPTPEDRPIQSTPYAQFDDILEAIRGPLSAHGFGVRFEPTVREDGRLVVTCFLEHNRGHWKKADSPPLKHDTTGSKNDVQAVGSAMSYGMRYALRGVLPIVSHAPQDKDDDGKAAGDEPLVEPDQVADIEARLTATGTALKGFLEWAELERLEDMRVPTYKRAVEYLAEKARRQKKGQPKAQAS